MLPFGDANQVDVHDVGGVAHSGVTQWSCGVCVKRCFGCLSGSKYTPVCEFLAASTFNNGTIAASGMSRSGCLTFDDRWDVSRGLVVFQQQM